MYSIATISRPYSAFSSERDASRVPAGLAPSQRAECADAFNMDGGRRSNDEIAIATNEAVQSASGNRLNVYSREHSQGMMNNIIPFLFRSTPFAPERMPRG